MSEQIDWCLAYEWGSWRSVPELVTDWSEMDEIEQEAAHLEWVGITENWLSELDHWASEGQLSNEQLRQYRQLEQLVRGQRPALRAMLGEDTAPTPTILERDTRR